MTAPLDARRHHPRPRAHRPEHHRLKEHPLSIRLPELPDVLPESPGVLPDYLLSLHSPPDCASREWHPSKRLARHCGSRGSRPSTHPPVDYVLPDCQPSILRCVPRGSRPLIRPRLDYVPREHCGEQASYGRESERYDPRLQVRHL